MLLIKNGTVIDPVRNTMEKKDLLIDGEKIVGVGEAETAAVLGDHMETPDILDAGGKMVAPGLTDVHVHFRDPGYTYKEDILTGAQAAAAGGFTRVALMANTRPCVDQTDTLRYVIDKGRRTGIRVDACANVTRGMKGSELTDMPALAGAGAVGFTDDGVPLLREDIVLAAMEQAVRLGRPLSFHEENPCFIKENGINAGPAAAYFGLEGSAREAEIDLVRRDLELALRTGAVINIQHISTREAVELVRQAKKRGGNIHAEATPHHFTLTQEAVYRHGTLAKMNPPLRTEEDRQAIIEGLCDGAIDLIATDHAPHSAEEKNRTFPQAPSGIIGLETALSLGIRELVNKGYLTLPGLIARMSLHPSELYGFRSGTPENLPYGWIRAGAAADLVIFDPGEEWTAGNYYSRSSNTPFTGERLPGVVYYTLCRGKEVYHRNGRKGQEV